MSLKLLLSVLCIVWRLSSAEDYTNHWLSADAASVEFCSHDSFLNGSCQCNVDYNGNFCLQRKCRNFGYNLNNGIDGKGFVGVQDRCVCPPGFLGRNCEPVTCVEGSQQVYSSLPSERTISILASYNSHMVESWKTGDIGSIICNYTGYGRNFNYNFDNLGLQFQSNDSVESCTTKVGNFLDPDTCMTDEDDPKPRPCQELNIDNLDALVQTSFPNSIIFVVTNMKLPDAQVDGPQTENIIATAIARRIQINVVVYNNTSPLLLASDPSLAYLQKIATATFGTFVLPSVKADNGQYGAVSALLNNWSNDIGVAQVFTDGMTLPIDTSSDIYITAQTYYKEDLITNYDSLTTVGQTDFWKLYKIEAANLTPRLSISNLVEGAKAYVYSSGRIKAYSAFTTDQDGSISIADASYSISVLGASYFLVVRLEGSNGVLQATDIGKTFGTVDTFQIGTTPISRYGCQFSFSLEATCTSVGPSSLTLITSDNRNSVTFPIYCASLDYGKNIYNNAIRETVEITHLPKQSFAQEFSCGGAEVVPEQYKQRSFVIVADNTKDTNATLSSVDNVFRGKDSVFLHLTDYVNRNSFHYSNYFATLTSQTASTIVQSSDYGKFLTKVMNQTSSAIGYSDAGNVSVADRLVNTIEQTSQYSDILFIVNYDVKVENDKIQTIKQYLAQKRIRLYVLFVQVYKPTTDDAYRFMNDFAVASGGVAVRLASYDDLHAFFDVYFANLVDNDIVAKAFSENQKPGIALNNVYLATGDYYLLLTNDDLSDNGPINASIVVDGLDVKLLVPIIGELQIFQITVATSASYNIPVRFAGIAQLGNVVLLTNSDNQDFVSLSFLDQSNKNRNDVVYGDGKFIPFLYSSTSFATDSFVSITYSDSVNPAKLIYNGSISPNQDDCAFKNFKYSVNYPWTCTQSGGLYHFQVNRFSNSSAPVSRTFPITCLGASSGDCLNGGTPSGDLCVCSLQWTGSKCETPVCLNGGMATPADTCDCNNTAFTGDFCETSISSCTPPTSPVPDYRSDLSSLIIVADAQALAVSGLSTELSITGTSITVILYGDGNAPRVVQSTTNGQRLSEVLNSSVNLPTPAPDAVNDMYKALNFALDTQFTSRAFIVLYTSNPDGDVDRDVLIRLAAKRAEIRVVTTSQATPYSANFKTISLLGNGIPTVVKENNDFGKYLTSYVVPIFSALQYQKSVTKPQRVFNVFQTGSFVLGTTVNIPADTTFDDADAIAFVQVNGGRYTGASGQNLVGTSSIYNVPYNQKDGLVIRFEPFMSGGNGTYSIEVLNYLKTAYGFSNATNGSDERLLSGLVSGQTNVLSIYSSPFSDLAASNPANFPFLSISEIQSDGTLSNSTTLRFTRKSHSSCFFKHFTVLDVCSDSSTIGYQVQLTTRSSALENRQQQLVWTCHKTTYQNKNTTCYAKGSPETIICDCDPGYEGIDCQTPQCENGGVVDGWFCRCPVPYFGRRCENAPYPIPTTTPGTTVTSTSVAATTTALPTSTAQLTTITTLAPSTQTTTAPKEVRAVAFVVDTIGLDDYAYNQSTQSIVEYVKAFNNVHYVMLVGNYGNTQMPTGFQKYETVDALATRLALYWNIRKTPADSKIANLSLSLDNIQNSYNSNAATLASSLSNNVFYLTQIALADDDNPSATDVPSFDKSSLVYSKFSQNADQATLDSLKKFSPTVTNVRDYYNGVKTMVSSTKQNEAAVLPPKPNRKCTFGLQTNIMVAIDRSMPQTNQIAENLNTFLPNFRAGFNYIDNDENRCGVNVTALPDFYNERTAITAFAYYTTVARSTAFCPSQYNIYMSFGINGSTPSPSFSDNQVKAMGKYINKADCSCNRYSDSKTMKLAIWLPRAKGPSKEEFKGYLKYNTDNAYHFVVPFYDMNDKPNDLFYQILVDQDAAKPDYYLLPNAATNSVDDIIDSLHEKICETAGVDPTAIPPEMSQMHFESRHDSFDNHFWNSETEN